METLLDTADMTKVTALSRAQKCREYGKEGDLAGPDKEHQEVSMLALHLLQAALVHVNTLLVQRVLSEPAWKERFTDADRRGLTALFWSNVRPYGLFELDMDRHLDFDLAATA